MKLCVFQAVYRGHVVRDAVSAWRMECAALCIQTMYRMYRFVVNGLQIRRALASKQINTYRLIQGGLGNNRLAIAKGHKALRPVNRWGMTPTEQASMCAEC